MGKRRADKYTDEELTALEISEDRRLRELDIAPDQHPAAIWRELLKLEKVREESDQGVV